MGFFTGQDKGTKARTETRERKIRKHSCGRPLNSNGKCPVCSAITRAHSSGRNAVRMGSHTCTDGKNRVTRNGICGGPC